ncbi:MAG TPA: hypothetical protein VFO16_13410 [Pseudonocardiaceae bacterium]|nr:hypothetical protein [Pseudonocardiaceae bacterium]
MPGRNLYPAYYALCRAKVATADMPEYSDCPNSCECGLRPGDWPGEHSFQSAQVDVELDDSHGSASPAAASRAAVNFSWAGSTAGQPPTPGPPHRA